MSQSASLLVTQVVGGWIKMQNLLESVIEDGNVYYVIWFSLEYESAGGCKRPTACIKVTRPAVRVGYYHVAWREFRSAGRKRVYSCGCHSVVIWWRVMSFRGVERLLKRGGDRQRTQCRCSRCGSGRHRIGKVQSGREAIIVVGWHLIPGMKFEHQIGTGGHHVLLLHTTRSRELLNNLITGSYVLLFLPPSLHLVQCQEMCVAVFLRHLHAGETDADPSVGRGRRYKVPADHIRRIDAWEARTCHGTGPFCVAIEVTIRPVAFRGCNSVAALGMKSHNRVAERRKTVMR